MPDLNEALSNFLGELDTSGIKQEGGEEFDEITIVLCQMEDEGRAVVGMFSMAGSFKESVANGLPDFIKGFEGMNYIMLPHFMLPYLEAVFAEKGSAVVEFDVGWEMVVMDLT